MSKVALLFHRDDTPEAGGTIVVENLNRDSTHWICKPCLDKRHDECEVHHLENSSGKMRSVQDVCDCAYNCGRRLGAGVPLRPSPVKGVCACGHGRGDHQSVGGDACLHPSCPCYGYHVEPA